MTIIKNETDMFKAVAYWMSNPRRADFGVDEKVQLALVEMGYGAHLGDVKNATEAAQLAAVRAAFENYYALKNPNELVQLTALTHGQAPGEFNIAALSYWDGHHGFQATYTPFSSSVLNAIKPGLAKVFADTEHLRDDSESRDAALSRFFYAPKMAWLAPVDTTVQIRALSSRSRVALTANAVLQGV